MTIAGIDVGTTGCKCTVMDDTGRMLAQAYEEYEDERSELQKREESKRGIREIDAGGIWKSVCRVLEQGVNTSGHIDAIGVTSFGETCVFVGADGEPAAKAMLYTDVRGEEQSQRLIQHFGRESLGNVAGVMPASMFSLPKWMWIRENRPELYEQTSWILPVADFIVFKLCGAAQTDYSLAARTMAFDVRTLAWDRQILDYAGIDMEKLPRIVATGTKAGTIRPDVAGRLGLSDGTIIVTGCHDQVAAAVGTGILAEGMAVDGTGTVECITPMFSHIPESAGLFQGNYAIVPYVSAGSYVCYAFSFTGGALLKWFRDAIASAEAKLLREQGKNPYEEWNRRVGDEPTGLLVLPYFAGAATPYMDPDAKGAVIGLTTETSSMELYRALMEGVTYEMRLNIERLEKAGVHIASLRATGGGAASKVWLQMKADILNLPIISMGAAQSGTLGCIMLTGVACGIYADLEEAGRKLVREESVYTPREEMHAAYEPLYVRYRGLYEAVKSVL